MASRATFYLISIFLFFGILAFVSLPVEAALKKYQFDVSYSRRVLDLMIIYMHVPSFGYYPFFIYMHVPSFGYYPS